jgi:3-oxoacyl-ACP reductase-like protein
MQFSIGDVLALLDKTILNPLVSSILVLCLQAFTSNPLIIRPNTNATSWIAYTIQRPIPIILARSLGLVAFGLVLCWNRWMSRRALNNGVKAVFDWEKEIILVTGAAGGIGATAVKKLLEKGSRVVVLDVLPLTYPKSMQPFYSALLRKR